MSALEMAALEVREMSFYRGVDRAVYQYTTPKRIPEN